MSAAPVQLEPAPPVRPEPVEGPTVRKRWTWRRVHTWVGMVGAVFLLLISTTGVVLTFRHSLKKPEPTVPVALQGRPALAPMELVAQAEAQVGARATELYFSHAPETPVVVVLGDARQTELWLAPSGELLETRYGADKTLTRWIFELHTGAILGRPGELWTALCGLSLLTLVISGYVLWPWRMKRAAAKARARR